MHVTYTAEFKENSPKIEEILKRLKANTDLEIELNSLLLNNSNIPFYEFISPLLKEGIGCYIDGNIITFVRGSTEVSYIFGATWNTIVQMGGEFRCVKQIPSWTAKKYSDLGFLRKCHYLLNKKSDKFLYTYFVGLIERIGFLFYNISKFLFGPSSKLNSIQKQK